MKNRIRKLHLQLFAEPATGNEPAGTQEPEPPSGSTSTKEPEPKQTTTTEPKGGKKAGNEPEPKYTDEDLDKILAAKFAKWEEKQKKAVDEAKKLEAMNAQQKLEYERDKLTNELNEYKKRDALTEMAKTARKMLSESNIVVGDELLSRLISDNADDTKAAVDNFVELFTAAVENAVKEKVRGNVPKGNANTSPATTMTKEQILAIKDHELRQQKMLENKALFPGL